MKWLLVLVCVNWARAAATAVAERNEKLISLFSIVSFQNEQCTSASSTSIKGTCFTSEQCASMSGTVDGNCAAGFGVCCVFKVSTCGSSVSKNCTYIQNPSYPSAFSSTGTTCTYTVDRFASDICQVRLDFNTLQTAAPAATGVCADTVVLTQPTGGTIPTICGNLDGQHMYIETSDSGTMATIAFTIDSTTATRMWNIKVSALECTSAHRAPTDCLQYHKGVTGTFNSLNFAGGIMLQSQQYKICFRQERGYCKISYRENANTSPSAFTLEDGPNAESTACAGSLLSFALPENAAAFICGGKFCDLDAVTIACTVTTDQVPFAVSVYVDNTDASAATGFRLDYVQVPCSNTAAD